MASSHSSMDRSPTNGDIGAILEFKKKALSPIDRSRPSLLSASLAATPTASSSYSYRYPHHAPRSPKTTIITATRPRNLARVPSITIRVAGLSGNLSDSDINNSYSPVTSSTTAPIAIPTPRLRKSRPTTPLTAREEKGHYFPYLDTSPKKPQISKSLKPTYQHPAKRSPNIITPYQSEISLVDMTQDKKSSLYPPSSPLSPNMPSSVLPPLQSTRPHSRQAPQHLNLGRFHPLNYQSPNSSIPNTPRTPRPTSSHRQFSEAQNKVHQLQRELVTNATKGSLPTSAKLAAEPNSPRLGPLRSPGLPMTPLALEGQGGYFVAGVEGSSAGLKEGEIVDKMIRKENQRIRHARPHSGRHSPVVSPAGGRC